MDTEYITTLIRNFEIFSSVTECIYVWDIQKKQFCCVKADDLFLCGYSAEEALRNGYDFYHKIIHPKDLSPCLDMQIAIFQYLKNDQWDLNEIVHFSCTFRLQRNYSFLPTRSLSQMIYHKATPVWEDQKLRYLICSVNSSVIKNTGNLRAYHKGRLAYDEYNFVTKRWEHKTKELLTEREKAILMLAEQGKSSVEIANILYKGHDTIRNQIKALFIKLDVHSMQEAREIAHSDQMIYSK